jgi:hypothetical protein
MERELPPRHAIGALLGALLGLAAALLFTLTMRDRAFTTWQLCPIFGITGALGGGVVGTILASIIRPTYQPYRRRRLVLLCIATPILTGTAGGALLLFVTVWTFNADATFGRALQAAAGGALLGASFGACSLPISAPLAFLLIRLLRQP